MVLMRRSVIAGAFGGGSAGVLVPLGIETAYWLGYLDPVVPHYLNGNVLVAWPTAAWLLYAGVGTAGRAFLVLGVSILANALAYAVLGAVVGAVVGAITKGR